MPGFLAYILVQFVAVSLVTFVVYAWDKWRARRGGWRTPESLLHTLSLLCGWPGALLAMRWLRHKTIKRPFRRVFWLTVVLNLVLVGTVAYLVWQTKQ